MYRRGFIPFWMCEMVPAGVGIMRAAANAFGSGTKERQGTISGIKASSKQIPVARMARGLAAADAAEALLDNYVSRYIQSNSYPANMEERAEMKMRAAYIVDMCRNEVNELA